MVPAASSSAPQSRARCEGRRSVLLDEPLANLDYKLREELRTELPRIFEASGAIFVYATTEPSEALLLGGRTICMWEGEILQVGDTPTSTAIPPPCASPRYFPIRRSTLSGSKRAMARCSMPAACRRRRAGFTRGLATVPTRSASAPPTRGRQWCGRPPRIFRTVTVTEITGSESFVHLHRDASNWVAVLQGVHEFPPGYVLDAVLDPDNVFVFDPAAVWSPRPVPA